MTNREFLELKEKLKQATNKELGEIYVRMGEKDPFKNSLVLPSVLREAAYKRIEAWFRNGMLTAKKNG
jgi:hypothetical protein